MDDRRPDLKINGSSSASGGLYRDVLINGDARIDGDTECEFFKVNGVASVTGNLKVKTGKINGTASIRGDLNATEFKVFGTSDLRGNLSGGKFQIEGSAQVTNISVEEIKLHGSLSVRGDCNAERFSSMGGFNIDGLLNAGTIEVDLFAPCRAKEVGGEKITVRRSTASKLSRLIKSIFLHSDDGLIAECIEGDDINLEYTKAKTVRGNNINLGPGCEIELVEYKDNFTPASESRIKEQRKIG